MFIQGKMLVKVSNSTVIVVATKNGNFVTAGVKSQNKGNREFSH